MAAKKGKVIKVYDFAWEGFEDDLDIFQHPLQSKETALEAMEDFLSTQDDGTVGILYEITLVPVGRFRLGGLTQLSQTA